MTEGRRRTRPWGPLKGPTPQANDRARLLRGWLNRRDLRLDDVLKGLTKEHFTSGRVPSRTTVSARLAGVALDDEFVEAIADVCSTDAAGRERLLLEARALTPGRSTPPPAGGAAPSPSGQLPAGGAPSENTAELVAVQRQHLATQGQLVRALERATELESARSSANQLVLVLLTMVERLRRDVETLQAERDRPLGRSAALRPIDQVRAELTRSEEQRKAAEAELERARAERHRADRLAEEAVEQVRVLQAALDQLRGTPSDTDAGTLPILEQEQTTYGGPEAGLDDIDQALAKASRRLDDGADRLDRLAGEMHRDNSPDNPATSGALTDNRAHSTMTNEPYDREAHAAALRQEILDVFYAAREHPGRFEESIRTSEPELVAGLVRLLYWCGKDADADDLLNLVGTVTNAADVPAIMDAWNGTSLPRMLLQRIAVHRPAESLLQVVQILRKVSPFQADQLLTDVSYLRPPDRIPPILEGLSEHETLHVLKAARTVLAVGKRHDLALALRRAGRPEHESALLKTL
ncbi:hypothetical protein OG864_02915 [Streptomyces sp. NBC_00124]|uniref:hypothetical protein n=1 Tax=Streptomyces sp. NBC_00124 TaxID=2975662 RepID=UPI00224F6DE2|nr:hypothetical protein [Streptomyces sp. NBC_00124]MCX5357689.1 hypothetical protein [Streptomyces sp. NBC_00124]